MKDLEMDTVVDWKTTQERADGVMDTLRDLGFERLAQTIECLINDGNAMLWDCEALVGDLHDEVKVLEDRLSNSVEQHQGTE